MIKERVPDNSLRQLLDDRDRLDSAEDLGGMVYECWNGARRIDNVGAKERRERFFGGINELSTVAWGTF